MVEEMSLKHFAKFFYGFLYCFFCLIAGCSTTLQAPKHLKTLSKPTVNKALIKRDHFETIGKIGFSDGDNGGNASIQWEQQGKNYDIRLFGPLGSGSIQIIGNSKHVSLIREDGKIIQAKDPESLVEKELGWVIPVSGLQYWLRGIPAPGAPPQQIKSDDENHIWQMKQQGWTINYQGYQETDGLSVPHKLLLQNGSIRLKFIFRRWRFYE